MDQWPRADAMYERLKQLLENADYPAHARLAAELLALSRSINYPLGVAHGLNGLGNDALRRGEAQEAEERYREALSYMRQAGDRVGEGIVLQNLGTLSLFVRLELQEARQFYEQGIAIFEACDQPRRTAITVANLAEISRLEGDFETSFRYATQSLQYFQSAGESERTGYHLVHVAYYRLLRRQYNDAIADLHAAYELLSPGENPEFISRYFETWFILACELRQYEVAARLLGFLERFRSAHDIMRLPFLMPWYAPQVERLQKHFSYEKLQELQQAGATLTLSSAEELTQTVELPEQSL
ncbi:MAG: hypothetical protein NVSMB31_02870 [Vulcanimicrobiaceae bacterium]